MAIHPDLVRHMKLCTVAVALDRGAHEHPQIIGTGFAITEQGHIMTNAHVAHLLVGSDGELSSRACVLTYEYRPGKGMQVTKGRVKAMMTVVGKTVEAGGVAYGGPPDLGILSTVFQGQTPYLKITERELLPEGAEVYFCGFPLGEEMFMGKHGQEQVTSTLQRGIIGAHLPFAGIAHPHGFVIDATSNGGNSGSAVIDPDTSEVIGVVFAKRTEAFTYAVCARGFGKITGYIDELESSGSAKKVITVPW